MALYLRMCEHVKVAREDISYNGECLWLEW